MLLVSQGVPMLLAGDEMSHTQQGNNNAYCQDNEISWLNWELDETQQKMVEFTRQLIAFRRSQPALHRRRFFYGRLFRSAVVRDVRWFMPSGVEMTDDDWRVPFARSVGCLLFGENVDVSETGDPVTGDTLLLLFNGDQSLDIDFVLPDLDDGNEWHLVIDSYEDMIRTETQLASSPYHLRACSVAIMLWHSVSHPEPTSSTIKRVDSADVATPKMT